MERPTVLATPFRQDLQHAAGVFFAGKAQNEVVRVGYQKSASLQARLPLLLEPPVQHIMQEDIGQQR
jgi:hypothetical protein